MALVAGLSRLRRSDQVLNAIRDTIERRKHSINHEHGVRSVTVTVKLENGTDMPRVVLMTVETADELSENGRKSGE